MIKRGALISLILVSAVVAARASAQDVASDPPRVALTAEDWGYLGRVDMLFDLTEEAAGRFESQMEVGAGDPTALFDRGWLGLTLAQCYTWKTVFQWIEVLDPPLQMEGIHDIATVALTFWNDIATTTITSFTEVSMFDGTRLGEDIVFARIVLESAREVIEETKANGAVDPNVRATNQALAEGTHTPVPTSTIRPTSTRITFSQSPTPSATLAASQLTATADAIRSPTPRPTSTMAPVPIPPSQLTSEPPGGIPTR